MNSLKFKENVCRICLKHKANLNWNEEISEFFGVSYKDCYYKYTQLEEMDPDFYPTNLCEQCGEELKNTHILIKKALNSFKILQDVDTNVFDMDIFNNSPTGIKIKQEASDMDDELLIEMEEKHLCASETSSNPEITSNELIEIDNSEVQNVDPTHFIDIKDLESSVDTPSEEDVGRLGDSKISKPFVTKNIRGKRKRVETILPESLGEPTEISDMPFNTEKASKRKKRQNNIETTEDYERSQSAFENRKKPSKKLREKYLLMCSYCSLKVDGAKKLALHEATHNENRERNVICSECGLKFYTDWSLTIHMKTHDENRQKNHKCEFCDKAFFNKGGLNVHKRVHLGLMKKCQICTKEFFRQVDLDKHLLKHSASPLEKNVGKKKYVAHCQYCKQSVLTEKLKEHIAIHLNQPQVKCKICDKNFFARIKLTRHLKRVHLKKLGEYEDFIHYLVDRNKRLTSLIIKQQFVREPLKQ